MAELRTFYVDEVTWAFDSNRFEVGGGGGGHLFLSKPP